LYAKCQWIFGDFFTENRLILPVEKHAEKQRLTHIKKAQNHWGFQHCCNFFTRACFCAFFALLRARILHVTLEEKTKRIRGTELGNFEKGREA